MKSSILAATVLAVLAAGCTAGGPTGQSNAINAAVGAAVGQLPPELRGVANGVVRDVQIAQAQAAAEARQKEADRRQCLADGGEWVADACKLSPAAARAREARRQRAAEQQAQVMGKLLEVFISGGSGAGQAASDAQNASANDAYRQACREGRNMC